MLLDFCAISLLENRALARHPSPQLAPPSHENEKVNVFLPPSAFLFNPKWVSNPTVEKDPIQWMRFSESKNPFYLILINKITHPLKFIKK